MAYTTCPRCQSPYANEEEGKQVYRLKGTFGIVPTRPSKKVVTIWCGHCDYYEEKK
jgi:hypothetical protein